MTTRKERKGGLCAVGTLSLNSFITQNHYSSFIHVVYKSWPLLFKSFIDSSLKMTSAIPQTQKALILHGSPGKFSIESIPVPQPKDGEVLVQILAGTFIYATDGINTCLF